MGPKISGCAIIVSMKPTFAQRYPILKDLLSLFSFIGAIVIGATLLNSYVYRSYNVVGSSMENTLHGDDRVIVNRLAVSWSHFLGHEYVPKRGQVIVFVSEDKDKVEKYEKAGTKNPLTCAVPTGVADQYIIKRVIAFPGERVIVKDGVLTVYNDEHPYPNGFHPDEATRVSDSDGPKTPTSGEIDLVVPPGELFVSGDNREGSHSWDSRNGLGTVPYCRVIGPVLLRLFPFDKIRTF